MRLVAKSVIVVLALVCSNTSSHGQSIRDNESVKRIIEVLNSMANDAKKWDDKAVAARTQAQIADLSWDTNHENAVEVLKADVRHNIRGGAAFLRRCYEKEAIPEGTTRRDIESWGNAIAAYSGIPQADLAQQHAVDVFSFIHRGYHRHGIESLSDLVLR